jgi:hypothetical protein
MAGSSTEPTGLKTFLEQMAQMIDGYNQSRAATNGWKYTSIEAFVLARGRPFIPAPLPKGVRKGTFKECFSDAYKLASRNHRYIYCEGYATSHIGVPVLHAWCFDTQRGVVVDKTWHDNRGQEYLGVPFNIDYVSRVIVRTGYYGVLGNLYMVDEERNPLMIAPEKYLHSLNGGK